jgi:hypothetical protein
VLVLLITTIVVLMKMKAHVWWVAIASRQRVSRAREPNMRRKRKRQQLVNLGALPSSAASADTP